MKKLFVVLASAVFIAILIRLLMLSGSTGAPTVATTLPKSTQVAATSTEQYVRDTLVLAGIPVSAVAFGIPPVGTPVGKDLVITLTTKARDEQLLPEDSWPLLLAQRTGELAYLNTSQRIDSVSVVFVNVMGIAINTGWKRLLPEMPSQMLVKLNRSPLSDTEVQSQFRTGIIMSANVQVEEIAPFRPNARLVVMRVTVPSTEDATSFVNKAIPDARTILEDLNSRNANIALLQMFVNRTDGLQLVQYVFDREMFSESYKVDPSIRPNWQRAPSRGGTNVGAPTLVPQPTRTLIPTTPLVSPLPTAKPVQ